MTYPKAAMDNKNFILPFFYFELGGHLGWKSGSPDTFWKGTTQESFQQSLVEIGSVVSVDNFFLNFIPPFIYFSLVAILVGSRDHQTHFGRGPSKDHSTKVWLQLAQWFLRRRLKCEMLTYGRRTKSDDNRPGELKRVHSTRSHK